MAIFSGHWVGLSCWSPWRRNAHSPVSVSSQCVSSSLWKGKEQISASQKERERERDHSALLSQSVAFVSCCDQAGRSVDLGKVESLGPGRNHGVSGVVEIEVVWVALFWVTFYLILIVTSKKLKPQKKGTNRLNLYCQTIMPLCLSVNL
jgi:hypothetical protein